MAIINIATENWIQNVSEPSEIQLKSIHNESICFWAAPHFKYTFAIFFSFRWKNKIHRVRVVGEQCKWFIQRCDVLNG